jgi:hypothetical protein
MQIQVDFVDKPRAEGLPQAAARKKVRKSRSVDWQETQDVMTEPQRLAGDLKVRFLLVCASQSS